jgi:hypothetical protein
VEPWTACLHRKIITAYTQLTTSMNYVVVEIGEEHIYHLELPFKTVRYKVTLSSPQQLSTFVQNSHDRSLRDLQLDGYHRHVHNISRLLLLWTPQAHYIYRALRHRMHPKPLKAHRSGRQVPTLHSPRITARWAFRCYSGRR